MTKDELRKKFNQDVENARKTQGEEAVARLAPLGKELYETPEEDLEKFIDKHFDELKSLPASGSDFRAFKKLEGRPKLANMFGYGGDAKGVDALFGNGKRSWRNYDDVTLNTIAKTNGFGSRNEMTAMLERMQAEYDKDKQEERSAKMAEDIRKAREQVVKETLYPDWKKHPIDWITAGIAKTAFSNITEAAREDALKGEGDYTTANPVFHPFNFGRDAIKFISKHPGDVAADAAITGFSMVPLGGIVARNVGLSRIGQVVGEGLYQGANTAAGELYGAKAHDKDIDWSDVVASAMMGGLFETNGKEIADIFKSGFGGKSKTVKKGADIIEDAFVNKKEAAQEYVGNLKERASKYNTTDNPGRADYKRTKDNYRETPITEEDLKKAKEAEELFSYIETGNRPKTTDKEFVLGKNGVEDAGDITRDMTDKEIYEAFERHPELKEYSGAKMRDATPTIKQKIVKFGVTHGPNAGKGFYKGYNYFKTDDQDRNNQELLRLRRLEKEFEKGNIPKTASDPNWKAYKDWAAKHPSKNDKAKILSFNY